MRVLLALPLSALLLPVPAQAMPIEASAPGFKYRDHFPALKVQALRNVDVHLFDKRGRLEKTFRLRNSRARARRHPLLDELHLDRTLFLPSTPRGSQRVALFLSRTVVGGSSWNGCYVQLLARDETGQLTVEQQFAYGCSAGAGASYDEPSKRLTIRSGKTDNADWEEKTRCWVGQFRWDGRLFVKVLMRNVPRPPGEEPQDDKGCVGLNPL